MPVVDGSCLITVFSSPGHSSSAQCRGMADGSNWDVNTWTHHTHTHTHPYRVTHEHRAVDAANLVIRTHSCFWHMKTFFCSPASYVPLSLRDAGRGKSSQVTTGWVMWHTEGSVKMIHEDENVRKWGEEQKEKEQNRLAKHFTVKSSSDLSTQFSVCLSSDNWKVVSVCTEPQGGRKHFLAGLDRLDNGRKKRTNAVRRQQREDWRRAAVRTCVCARVHNPAYMYS